MTLNAKGTSGLSEVRVVKDNRRDSRPDCFLVGALERRQRLAHCLTGGRMNETVDVRRQHRQADRTLLDNELDELN